MNTTTESLKTENSNIVIVKFIKVITVLILAASLIYYFIKDWNLFGDVYKCDTEVIQKHEGNYFFAGDTSLYKGGQTQSKEFAHSGKSSSKLYKAQDFEYGLDITIPDLKEGDKVTCEVWKYSPTGNQLGVLVASIDNNKFWKGESNFIESEGDWVKIKFDFTITKDYEGKPLTVLCWNSAEAPVYFDDLTIQVEKK